MRDLVVFIIGIGLFVGLTRTVGAHEVTYEGSVLIVETARLQLRVTDAETKHDLMVWISVNAATKVRRGDKAVPYKDARITQGEHVTTIVEHEAKTNKLTALLIKLAPKP